MKNDLLLRQEIDECLAHENELGSALIGVEVHHGFVKLAGYVPTEAAKTRAQRATQKVDGVREVVLDLDVSRP